MVDVCRLYLLLYSTAGREGGVKRYREGESMRERERVGGGRVRENTREHKKKKADRGRRMQKK